MTIGKNIKTARKIAGMTQKELAEKLKTSQQNLAQYENDKRKPKLETLEKIASALGVRTAQLAPELVEISNVNLEVIHNMESLLRHLPEMNLPDKVKEMHRQTAINTIEKHQNELAEMNLLILSDAKQRKLLTDFLSLNDNGKQKAVEQVELLTKIPEYQGENNSDTAK